MKKFVSMLALGLALSLSVGTTLMAAEGGSGCKCEGCVDVSGGDVSGGNATCTCGADCGCADGTCTCGDTSGDTSGDSTDDSSDTVLEKGTTTVEFNGEELEVTIAEVSAQNREVVAAAKADIKSVLSNFYDSYTWESSDTKEVVKSAQAFDAIEITLDKKPAGGFITLDIRVNGVKKEAGSRYGFMHWTGKKWELVNATCMSDGVLRATFTNFSPFIPVKYTVNTVPKDGADDDDDDDSGSPAPLSDNGTPVSPKTGETIPVAGCLAVISLAGAFVCIRREKFTK
ncbi:MAG: hypothetical protein J1E64_06935 [Acetatifactor sp.]|nr:hypothetical protein [Acetatifactor sp.]